VPGSYLYETLKDSRSRQHGNVFLDLSGTSMSAAVGSGVAALVIDANRRAADDGAPGLQPNGVKAILEYSAIPLGRYDVLTQGVGEANAAGGIALAGAIDTSTGPGKWWLRSAVPTRTVLVDGHRRFSYAWAANIVWGDNIVWGNLLFYNLKTWSQNIVWGDNIVWGNTVVWGNNIVWGNVAHVLASNIVWGNTVVWGNNIVWGNQTLGIADGDNIVWGNDGDNIVWGNDDNIVWGNATGDNIVWGNSRRGNIVWGNLTEDNIVWGNLADDNIVWGNSDDNIVWGNSDGDNIVWGNALRQGGIF
jgi:hypothetical protein